jgi:purine-binding chemotaxis protein CheW
MNTAHSSAARNEASDAAGSGAGASSAFLTFQLSGEAFAIGILAIKEIIEYGDLTEVPMMPACVRGVINLRGAVVPVLDLQARFGRVPAAVSKRTCVVIVEVGSAEQRQVVGVVVDAVNEVLDILHADIEPAPDFGTRISSDFIRGMGKVRGRFVIMLDVDKVLSLDEFEVLAALPSDGVAEMAH